MLAWVARSRMTTPQRIDSTMTMRQIELEVFFLHRERMREMRAHKFATAAAIAETLGGR